MDKQIKEMIGTFFSLIIVGTFIDIMIKAISETPNPFIPKFLINILEVILPSFMDSVGLMFTIIWTIIISVLNKKFNIFK